MFQIVILDYILHIPDYADTLQITCRFQTVTYYSHNFGKLKIHKLLSCGNNKHKLNSINVHEPKT